MSRKLSLSEMTIGGLKFMNYLVRGGLFNINLEVTKRCNARCNFCDYWWEGAPHESVAYVPLIRKLKPLSVSLTGGEPLLRRDLPHVIRGLRRNFGFLFISLITNGSLLTLERGIELWESGLDELSISLDYLDDRHDMERGLPGLSRHILSVTPRLRGAGVNVCFNVVIKRGNYREIPQILQYAAGIGTKISLSTYNCWRVDNESHMIGTDELKVLTGVIQEVKCMNNHLGNLTTDDYYLDRIPAFFADRGVSGCTAGLNWIQVTPDGMIKRCPDHPVVGHFSEWHTGFFKPTHCRRCWYSCRGAAQEPWTLRRFVKVSRDTLAS